MRQTFISSFILPSFVLPTFIMLAVLQTASASDRYPVAKRYVNQTGQIALVHQTSSALSANTASPVDVLPALKPNVPDNEPALAQTNRQPTAARAFAPKSLLGAIDERPENWPSSRKCCQAGQPYFNEFPNS